MSAIKGQCAYLRMRVDGTPQDDGRMEKAIEARRFLPLHADAETSEQAGWAPIERPHDDEVPVTRDLFAFGNLVALAYREDKYIVPRPVLARRLRERLKKIEEEEGKEITRAFAKAVEKAVLVEVKRQIIPRSRVVDVIWDTNTNELRVFAKGTVATERIASLFERTFQVRVEVATYSHRAFAMPLPSVAAGILERLSPQPLVEPTTVAVEVNA